MLQAKGSGDDGRFIQIEKRVNGQIVPEMVEREVYFLRKVGERKYWEDPRVPVPAVGWKEFLQTESR